MDRVENPFARAMLVGRVIAVAFLFAMTVLGVLAWLISKVAPADWTDSATVVVLGSLGLGMVVLGLAVNAVIGRLSADPSAYCVGACVAIGFAFLGCLEGFIASVSTHALRPYLIAALLAGCVVIGVWPREKAWRKRQARRAAKVASVEGAC